MLRNLIGGFNTNAIDIQALGIAGAGLRVLSALGHRRQSAQAAHEEEESDRWDDLMLHG